VRMDVQIHAFLTSALVRASLPGDLHCEERPFCSQRRVRSVDSGTDLGDEKNKQFLALLGLEIGPVLPSSLKSNGLQPGVREDMSGVRENILRGI
jgi:hypothetical protein